MKLEHMKKGKSLFVILLFCMIGCSGSVTQLVGKYQIVKGDPYEQDYQGYTLTSDSHRVGYDFAILNLRNLKYSDEIIIAEQKTDSINRWTVVKAKKKKLSYYMSDTILYNQTKHQVDSIINRYQYTDFKELVFIKD